VELNETVIQSGVRNNQKLGVKKCIVKRNMPDGRWGRRNYQIRAGLNEVYIPHYAKFFF
jgi:hypothetical protein